MSLGLCFISLQMWQQSARVKCNQTDILYANSYENCLSAFLTAESIRKKYDFTLDSQTFKSFSFHWILFTVFCLQQSSETFDVLHNSIFVIISEILLFLCFQEAEKQQLKDQLEEFKRVDKEKAEKARSQKEEAEKKEEERKRLVKEQEER